MAISKQSFYEIGVNNDLSNVSVNVDRNRLGADFLFCEISGGNLLIKVGSVIEANGSVYRVEDSDISITLIDGIIFFDDETNSFLIEDTNLIGLDRTRVGYYRINQNTNRKASKFEIENGVLYSVQERSRAYFICDKNRNSGELRVANKVLFSKAKGDLTPEFTSDQIQYPPIGFSFFLIDNLEPGAAGVLASVNSTIGGNISKFIIDPVNVPSVTNWFGLVYGNGIEDLNNYNLFFVGRSSGIQNRDCDYEIIEIGDKC
jgi:hypothetical protein